MHGNQRKIDIQPTFFIMLCCCVIILLLSHQVKTYHVLLLAKASGEGQQKNLGEKMLSKSLVLVVLFFHGQGVPTSFRIFFQKHKKCNLNFPDNGKFKFHFLCFFQFLFKTCWDTLDFKLKTMTMNGKPGKSLIDH